MYPIHGDELIMIYAVAVEYVHYILFHGREGILFVSTTTVKLLRVPLFISRTNNASFKNIWKCTRRHKCVIEIRKYR